MRWLWGRRKVSRTDRAKSRPFDPIPEPARQQRIRTINQCETLLRYIGQAYEKVEAASADLAGNPETTLDAWAVEVVQAGEMVEYAAHFLNYSAPPGRQLPYRYLKRIRHGLAARNDPDPARIAQVASYREALTTLRRDTERLRARLIADDEVSRRMD